MLNQVSHTFDRDDFLTAMRNVANSVTVVTTNGAYGHNGVTVSSFCSVSADPPTLLVCLNRNGSASQSVRKNARFCVNILPENHSKTAIAFAMNDKDIDTLFSMNHWQHNEGTCPSIIDATTFFCDVSDIVASASHDIFIGLVRSVSYGNKKPLIYLDQTFHSIG